MMWWKSKINMCSVVSSFNKLARTKGPSRRTNGRFASAIAIFLASSSLVLGELEVEYKEQKYIMHAGDTLDASKYHELLSFYSIDETEILIEMTANIYESNFRDTEIVQKDAASIQRVDGYTFHHCSRIKDYSIELWKKLGQPIERLTLLRWGAYFHEFHIHPECLLSPNVQHVNVYHMQPQLHNIRIKKCLVKGNQKSTQADQTSKKYMKITC